jgi:hypothetical protein
VADGLAALAHVEAVGVDRLDNVVQDFETWGMGSSDEEDVGLLSDLESVSAPAGEDLAAVEDRGDSVGGGHLLVHTVEVAVHPVGGWIEWHSSGLNSLALERAYAEPCDREGHPSTQAQGDRSSEAGMPVDARLEAMGRLPKPGCQWRMSHAAVGDEP